MMNQNPPLNKTGRNLLWGTVVCYLLALVLDPITLSANFPGVIVEETTVSWSEIQEIPGYQNVLIPLFIGIFAAIGSAILAPKGTPPPRIGGIASLVLGFIVAADVNGLINDINQELEFSGFNFVTASTGPGLFFIYIGMILSLVGAIKIKPINQLQPLPAQSFPQTYPVQQQYQQPPPYQQTPPHQQQTSYQQSQAPPQYVKPYQDLPEPVTPVVGNETVQGMFCSQCGTKNDGDALFCSNCGAKL